MAKDTNTCNTIDVERDNEEAPLSELVSEGQVIAVHAVGQDHDYFYLKVPEKVKILNSYRVKTALHETQFPQLVLRSSRNFIVTIESPVI